MQKLKIIAVGTLFLISCNQATDTPPEVEAPKMTIENASAKMTNDGPFQTTGVKIGEVTDSVAIVWTRLPRESERVTSEAPWPTVLYKRPDSEALQEDLPGRLTSTNDRTTNWLEPVTISLGL